MKTPSVTQAISPWVDWSKVPPHLLQTAAERGTNVHDICLMRIARGLFVSGIPSECAGYVESYQRWFDLMVDEVIFVEERLRDKDFGFNGQPDSLIKSKQRDIIHADLKTPVTSQKAWRLQIAAYDHLIEINKGIVPDRSGSLQLNPDGGIAKMTYYEGSRNQDFAVFLSVLNAYRFFNA